MIKIRNCLDQPVVIHRGPAKVLHLLAGAAVAITEQELRAPQIQSLIAAGALRPQVLKPAAAKKEKEKEDERPSRKREG